MNKLAVYILISTLALCCELRGQSSSPTRSEVPLFLRVELDRSVKLSSLKPGESVEGNLTRDVYSPEKREFASGSHIRLLVTRVDRRPKTHDGKWPWIAKMFLPRHENSPVFNQAAILMPDGTNSVIQTSFLSASRMKEVRLPAPRNGGKKPEEAGSIGSSTVMRPANDASGLHGPVLYVEAYRSAIDATEGSGRGHFTSTGASMLPAGTLCRVLLLENVSASKSHVGDAIHARLLEPIVSDSKTIVPAGSVFEGRVMKATRPRMPSRAGSLAIAFDSVLLPEGQRISASASLASVDVNTGSPLKMDREGRLHGSRPGAMWMLINGGIAGGLAKEVDDGTQLIVEALISSATDVSTAGTARIAGSIVSGVFMLTRKGQDVVLPNHTEMAITLTRPITFSAEVASVAGGEVQTVPSN